MNIFKNLGQTIGILNSSSDSRDSRGGQAPPESLHPTAMDLKTILEERANERNKKRSESSIANLYSKITKANLSHTVKHLDLLRSGSKNERARPGDSEAEMQSLYKLLCLQKGMFQRERAEQEESDRRAREELEQREFKLNERVCELDRRWQALRDEESRFKQSKEILEKAER